MYAATHISSYNKEGRPQADSSITRSTFFLIIRFCHHIVVDMHERKLCMRHSLVQVIIQGTAALVNCFRININCYSI